MTSLINAALFQVTWFACVLGGAAGRPWWGVPALCAMLGFSVLRSSLRADLVMIVALIPLGFLLDYVWIESGLLDYRQTGVPNWILLLWAGVALTINHSLAWFGRYPLAGAMLAAVAAPVCYLGGEQLGAVSVPAPLSLAWISVSWFVIFFGVFRLGSIQVGNSESVRYG